MVSHATCYAIMSIAMILLVTEFSKKTPKFGEIAAQVLEMDLSCARNKSNLFEPNVSATLYASDRRTQQQMPQLEITLSESDICAQYSLCHGAVDEWLNVDLY